MRSKKDEVAEELVQQHFRVEPELERVFVLPFRDDETIRLLEVNSGTFATERVEVFVFGPQGGLPYTTAIAEVTPDELDKLREGALALPSGWSLEDAREIIRPQIP